MKLWKKNDKLSVNSEKLNDLDGVGNVGQFWNEISQITWNVVEKILSIFFHRAPEAELAYEPYENGNVIEEVLYFARQITLEVDNEDVQESLNPHNQELKLISS